MSTINGEQRADRRNELSRDAIGKTAKTLREASARGGVHLTQTEATSRVIKARESGDLKRSS